MEDLTLITATGGRPAAWKLCQRWMSEQAFCGSVRWIVVDDCDPAQSVEFSRAGWTVEILRPRPRWSGRSTQARNLGAALSAVAPNERVVVIEDDDVYSPDWLGAVHGRLSRNSELVGEARSRYYHAVTGAYRKFDNSMHSSLCSTAVSGAGLVALRAVVNQCHDYIDVELWRRRWHIVRRRFVMMDTELVVGIKGLPGRKGLGIGHAPTWQNGEIDRDGSVLAEWVGLERSKAIFEAAGRPSLNVR